MSIITPAYTLNDIQLVPRFSEIRSRKDVDTNQTFLGTQLRLPIVSSNMDTIFSPSLAVTLAEQGAISCIHRFYKTIDENVKDFNLATYNSIKPWVSVGLGGNEIERADSLIKAGAEVLFIDVAHGASIGVVEQYNYLRARYGRDIKIVVGNFATGGGIREFNNRIEGVHTPDAYKIGVGNGSVCQTTIVTGMGVPSVTSIQSCLTATDNVILDGGIKNSGDLAKALALGVKMVMSGNVFAGTKEVPGSISLAAKDEYTNILSKYKVYRGSASLGSYETQGKVSDWRTPEGVSVMVPYKGPVKPILQELEAGLRSSMSYVGARNLKEFREKSDFYVITQNGRFEASPNALENTK